MINYGRQFIDKADVNAVVRTLKSDFLTQGEEVLKFEENLSKYFKSKYVTVVNSGTSALYLTIKSLKLKKNSKILTTPITFAASAASIIYNNHIPILCDINLEDYTLDLNLVEKNIKKNNVKCVIAVDYAGHPCDWNGLNSLKKKYGIILINDNCHAIGSKIDNDIGYSSKYADVTTHSYHPVKNLTTGEGGAILTNNFLINQRVKLLRSHNIMRNERDKKEKGIWYYRINQIGYNFRITDFQCSLGISQLKKLKRFINERRVLAKLYDNNFKKVENILFPKVKKKYFHSYHLYPLLINFGKFKINKKTFFNNLIKKGIKLQVHYVPLYKQPFIKKFLEKNVLFPNSETFYNREVSLPIYYGLKIKQIKYICKSIKDLLN